MTCYQEIACPNCGRHQVVKAGYSARGEHRYRCENPGCPTKSFILSYRYKAYEPGIKETVVERAINSSGIRDTARVLGIAKGTVVNRVPPPTLVAFLANERPLLIQFCLNNGLQPDIKPCRTVGCQ